MLWRGITLVLVSILVLETAVLVNIYLLAVFPITQDELAVSRETLLLFNSYDVNGDGTIDLGEFEAVKLRISQTHVQAEPYDLINDNEIDRKFEDLKATTGEILDIKSEFTPLVLDSMSKFKDDHALQEGMEALTGLRKWQSALKKDAVFPVEALNVFLPKWKIDLGEPWSILNKPIQSQDGPSLSSDRYHPPAVTANLVILQYLLQMFHPRAFLFSRFPPQGAVACIRAENENFIEIIFRLHSEFQLNEPPLLPFWFTPAQFSGHIIITKDGKHIEHFEMEVPSNQTLNVDMEWLTKRAGSNEESKSDDEQEAGEQNNMEVDIGYLPKMKLKSKAPSYPHDTEVPSKSKEQEIKWLQEISQEEARIILEKKMYPFKEVPYLSFGNAYIKAKEEKKLVHSILLWGALDDQSC